MDSWRIKLSVKNVTEDNDSKEPTEVGVGILSE